MHANLHAGMLFKACGEEKCLNSCGAETAGGAATGNDKPATQWPDNITARV